MAKSIKHKALFFIIFFSLSSLYSIELNSYPDYLLILNRIYGKSFDLIDSNTIIWDDGEILQLDDGINKTSSELIENADIADQFKIKYPKGELLAPPATPADDPGRVRNDKFFKKLYGETPEEVRKNLKPLKWLPNHCNTTILFNTKFGAWESLKKVSDELDNGFIWGGKWYHYDTMHFEYRPELL